MTEGENGERKFRFTRKGIRNPDITVRYTLSQIGSFLTSGQTGTKSILIPSMNMTSGPQQHKFLDLNVHDDDTTEPDGSVTIVLLENPRYCIEDRMAWARVRIYDDDQPAGATLPDTAWRTGPGGVAQAGKVQHMEAIFSDLMMFILATFIKEAGNPSQAPVCAGDRRARLG